MSHLKRFFVGDNPEINPTLSGEEFKHAINVLRIKEGDEILVCDNSGYEYVCKVIKISKNELSFSVISKDVCSTETKNNVTLVCGYLKGDKTELVVQKAVELGVTAIIPVQMSRSIVKIEEKKKGAKTERWQAIAESAGKQSKRSVIPKVYDVMSFDKALEFASETDLFLLPYENKNGMVDTKNALNKIKKGDKISVLVGPEGGFSDSEIDKALSNGANVISLGKRILRTETASILSVGMLMLHAETNL